MSYLVFARKYRPQTFEQVVQQTHVTRTLSNAIASGRVAHAILFTGPRGTGKTTVARILAKAMNCAQGPTPTPCNTCRSCLEITAGNAVDVFEIDGASNNSVDQVRDLRDNLKYMPVHSRFKIYIIDEVHMLSLAAFNALLKTLEEPPAHILFMFATTEQHKIPVTILSRCQRHDLRRIDAEAIAGQLGSICKKEQVQIDQPSLDLIAQEAGGSMRDALSLMDHVLACAQGPITAQLIGELLGVVDRRHLFEISQAVFARDIQKILEKIDAVWRQGYEIKRFYADLVAHFHHLAMIKLGPLANRLVDVPTHEIEQMHAQVSQVPETYITQIFDLLFQAEPSIKLSAQPKLALEMIFVKLFQASPMLPIETLIERLDQLRTNINQGLVFQPGHDKPQADSTDPIHVPINARPQAQSDDENASDKPTVQNQPEPLNGDRLWEHVVSHMEAQRPSLAAFLKKCHFKKVEDGRIAIEVQDNEFTFNTVKKQIPFLENVCNELSGQAIKLDLLYNIDDAAAKKKQKKESNRLKQKALSHPLVMEALELFDGKVIDVKVQ